MSDSFPVVTIKPRRALPLFSRHPWVFAGTIKQAPADLTVGRVVAVHSNENEFIAYGLYNPISNIRVRLYSWDINQPPDDGFFGKRITESIALRRRLFEGTGTWHACRLVFSEADGLSGLTVDRYGNHLLVQWTSAALAAHQGALLDVLSEQLRPEGIWLRTERGIGEAEGLELRDGLVAGNPPPRPLFIEENGLRFGVDVVEGHKTGYYFDQRENRLATARYTRERRVLDLFCYTGGFAITAAGVGAAAHVTAVDSSGPALAIARQNAELNEVHDRVEFQEGDVFRALEALRDAGERFDVVILDPPKMARTRGGLKRALRGYHSLNRLAMDVLGDDGILVTCSCSGLVDRLMFQEVLAKAALDAGRSLQILESRGAAVDHPVNIHCVENAYLKCFICRIV